MLLQPYEDKAFATFTAITWSFEQLALAILVLTILAPVILDLLILDLVALDLVALEPVIFSSQPSSLTP